MLENITHIEDHFKNLEQVSLKIRAETAGVKQELERTNRLLEELLDLLKAKGLN